MYDVIKSYVLYFNTREANSGTSNNCTWRFTTPLILTNTNNRFVISTPMVELPYSFSQVNTTNYNLPYRYVDSNGKSFTSTSMNVPEGNYNINQLQAQLAASLVADIALYWTGSTITVSNFNFSYSPQTGTTTMSMGGLTFTVTITLLFSSSYVIGIMNGFPQVDQTFGTAVTLISPNKVMCNPITSVYIRSENLKYENNYEAIVQSYQNSDVVCKIPVTTLPNSIIYYRNDQKSMISNKFLSDLNLYVSDNLTTSYTLDLQGVNYGISLLIEEVQLKANNAYRDRLTYSGVAVPHQLIQERDNILRDLIAQKEALQREIEEQKQVHEAVRDKEINPPPQ